MKRSQIRCWKSYCSEPLDKIERYEEALAEDFAGWCIHHQLEIQQDGASVSAQELIDKGLYYDRPASELVFMRFGEHSALHRTGKHHSAEARKKMSESKKGENNPFFGKHRSAETCKKLSEANKGKHLSEETRKKLSESHRGENHPLFGKHRSAETRQKISESLSGEKNPLFGKRHSEETRLKMSEAHKGKLWWNNGVSCIRSKECPGEGWTRGRLRFK